MRKKYPFSDIFFPCASPINRYEDLYIYHSETGNTRHVAQYIALVFDAKTDRSH